ncbi:ornithine cyclodeaminase family protein [Nitrospirillum sp. BR 11163]|uniref:ornithine cyclodeaminase family protein n=1 Tax=Nitrospirillum sp. BR 11163 TaxID=3104323 RepID=UPI002AFF0277|nr:ornithine cyclodeaminase family protein [Nitrospirillum sp. BR 11163]MEA1673214.1 ornithine cyclodeaminase family protein [Nitrospirillum sp. BR 11163]
MSQNTEPTPLPLFLTDADVRSVFDWKAAADALKTAYAAPAAPDLFPPRTMARRQGLWLRTLSGIAPDGGLMGAKLISANIRAGVASYLIPLLDQETAELVALLDGNSITGFRTAVTSAVVADALASAGALRVAVIGSGFEAKNHVRALAALRPLDQVSVYSPNPDSRARFIAELGDLGIPMRDADSARATLGDADVAICAARSRDESPTLLGGWLRPGMTVISIGSTLPEQRELDPEAIRRADLIVADMVEEVAHDTGDMIAAARAGVGWEGRLVALADVIGGRHPARTAPDQILLYKSVGAAIQDLAVAALCAGRARQLGIGTMLPVSITPVRKGKK